MERAVDLNEISDGKLYSANDLVKADCNGCKDCSACCRGMGDSIVLDPLDWQRLQRATGRDFHALLEGYACLRVVDGMILPCLSMQKETDACIFLSSQGRCTIHADRPGFCRLFPLGRYYHDGTFSYFLQTAECKKTNRSKIKVRKWVGEQKFTEYERFICEWHYFLKDMNEALKAEEAMRKQIVMYVIQEFYAKPYPKEEIFYEEFEKRLEKAKAAWRFL